MWLGGKTLKIYKTAIYTRLSKEDGDKAESDSIINQRALINDFLKPKTDIQVIEEFTDDGFSGGNFDRPGFLRMLKAIDSKEIDCVIVKDLSRFGRNYIEVGRYIERVFPEKGVRLIAINDNYDSIETRKSSDNIILPFKNLLNDAYLRDISVKIKSQLSVKRNRGEYVGNFVAYGYVKDERNKSKLVIDKEAAEVVKSIFHLYLSGISPDRISEKLNKMGVLSPLEYKKSIGIRMNDCLKKGYTATWSAKAIRNILENEIYTGVCVQGKYRKINYRVKKSIKKPKKEWVRVEDTHEYIIEPKMFALAGRLMSLDTRVPPNGDTLHIFSGFVYCGDCGESMVRKINYACEKNYPYLVCNSFKIDRSCSTHCISEEKLIEIVFHLVQNMINLIVNLQHFVSRLDDIPMQRKTVINLGRQIDNLNEEIERYKKLKQRIYEDYAEQVLSREEYDEYRNVYSDKINACKSEMEKVNKERTAEISSKNAGDEWIQRFKKYKGIDKLTRPLLADLVDKILVFNGKRIEIRFNLQDEIKATLSKLQDKEDNQWQEKAEKILV